MNGELVGRVTEEEKNELLVFYERKLGIEELTATLESGLLSNEKIESLQDKMITELGRVKLSVQAWWDRMHKKYKWERLDGYQWRIDFDTCEISLIN